MTLQTLDDALTLTADEQGALTAVLTGDFSNGQISAPPEKGFPFGGLLAALAAKAMREGLGLTAPLRSLSVQYLAAAGDRASASPTAGSQRTAEGRPSGIFDPHRGGADAAMARASGPVTDQHPPTGLEAPGRRGDHQGLTVWSRDPRPSMQAS